MQEHSVKPQKPHTAALEKPSTNSRVPELVLWWLLMEALAQTVGEATQGSSSSPEKQWLCGSEVLHPPMSPSQHSRGT